MAHLLSGVLERRAHPRAETAYEIHARSGSWRKFGGTLTDLSRAGAFLRFGAVGIREGDFLELAAVAREHDGLLRIWRRTALVLRLTPTGVGVMFLRTASPWRDEKWSRPGGLWT
jgi:hypothetical protein